MKDLYVIQEGWGTVRGELNTYWSNKDGWTDLTDATCFTLEEVNSFDYLPIGAACAVKLPSRKKFSNKRSL